MRGRHHLAAIAFVAGAAAFEMEGFYRLILLSFVIAWLSLWISSWKWKGSLFIFFLAGALLSVSKPSLLPIEPSSSPMNIKIISPLKESSSTIQTTLYHSPSHNKIQLLFLISDLSDSEVQTVKKQLKYGAVCLFSGEVKSPEQARNYGQFDYRMYLKNQGIQYQSLITSLEEIQCEGKGALQKLFASREALIVKVSDSMDKELFAWTSALIFGDTSLLDEEIIEWFREFSLSHILAISGLHIGLFISGLYLLFYRTGRVALEQTRWLLVIILPCYSFLAGGAPSVLRASFMAGIFFLLIQRKLRFPITDVLSLAAGLLLLWNPYYLHNLGYQFSFLVTFALVLAAPLLKQQQSWKLPASISLISQLMILPLQLHYFYQYNPFSLFANLLLVPYFSLLVIPVLFLFVIISFIIGPSTTVFLSGLFYQFHEAVVFFMMKHWEIFNLQWVVGELPIEWMLMYWVGFFGMMYFWCQKKRSQAFLLSILSVAVIVSYMLLPYVTPKGTVTMLDVGQGDTFIIELPYRRNVIMIDAAGPSLFLNDQDATFDHIIHPYLKSRGIRSIGALFISHGDQDHNGSTGQLLNNYEISSVFTHPFNQSLTGTEEFLEAGQIIDISGVNFHVLHPDEDYLEENDNSLVLYVELGGKKWLFTGDISQEVESKLLKSYPQLTADVLKLAHHGSRTSTSEEWLKKLQPSAALISAGVNNRYGHPHEEIVELLEMQDILVLRTDWHGAVRFQFTKERGTFSTFLPYNAERRH
ncbi:DNA internalization-related competence protein ComEC/Rec2 [Halobacillus sp. Marseille-Q1614]|uniref:DNA internalization-related competence protein ComEC/Rec2 n=1 Tax=Halobacillus sp. Marseille-Q1614 TaxID=2709134 RepID=UPI00157042F5|nr:DNA internalization-related competence protein ComEC/Rec2 [Halobacillus sp. Marseille-Q1614]